MTIGLDINGLVVDLAPTTAAPMSLIDIDLGTSAHSGRFTIQGANFDPSKRVVINPAPAPYSGKGSLTDEAEMDAITVLGSVLDATHLECFWHAIPGPVRGHFNFQYRLANP